MSSPENPLEAAPVLPGETLAGKYRVEKVLGKGGMGIVVAARHLELEERVAIKFLIGERAPTAIERFLREARAAAKVKSEHVCRVHDVGRLESGEPYMVLEHLEGIDLGLKLERDGTLSVEEAASVVIEVCVALAEAHALGIVHRDLKPANIFLAERNDGSRCVKVLDFGISKVPSTSEMTSTAVLMGSPLYMSPEQIASSRSVDARSDIWSLGVVLFELVAGAPPFSADSIVQLAVMIREQAPTKLTDIVVDAPPGFVTIIERCLAKRPEDRYASVKELALDLARFASAEAAHLASRIGGGRPPAHSDPALVATAHDTPSDRALRAATPPNRTPPGDAPVSEKVGRATFAPLHTTMRDGPSRHPRWLVPAAAVLGIAGIAFAVTRLQSTPRSDASPASVVADVAIVPIAPAPSSASTVSAEPSSEPTAPPTSTAHTTPAPTAAPRPPKAAAPRAATTAASSVAAPVESIMPEPVASPSPAPSPPPEPPATRKKRSLDRDEVY